MKKVLRELAAYCASNIDDFDLRSELALRRMERMRCSLEYADRELYDAMSEAVVEYADGYGVNVEDINVEDILWMD